MFNLVELTVFEPTFGQYDPNSASNPKALAALSGPVPPVTQRPPAGSVSFGVLVRPSVDPVSSGPPGQYCFSTLK